MRSNPVAPAFFALSLLVLCHPAVVRSVPGQPAQKKLIKIAVPVSAIVAKVHVRDGQKVNSDEILIQLDERLARNDVDRAKVVLELAKTEYKVAKSAEVIEQQKYILEQKLFAQDLSTTEQVAIARASWERHIQQTKSRAAAIKIAEIDLETANVVLGMHQVRAPRSGTVQAIHVAPGEGVKELDIVVEIAP
jgi:multidrug efflux pump subunit AcrA (membrane-fusion protein)